MRILIDPDGFVVFEGQRLRCALGKGGLKANKREGDGATPIGDFALGRVFYRADRLKTPPQTGLERVKIETTMGWCDAPDHADYNQLITLPHPASHETMWRDDHLYDVVVEVLYNATPIEPGRGSAIFMHIAKPDYSPTEGCMALKIDDLLLLLRNCNEDTMVSIPNLNSI